MDLKDIALARALGMLKASGVTYVVINGDTVSTSAETTYIVKRGVVTMQSEESPLMKVQKRAIESKPRASWKFTGYREALAKLQPGDSWTYMLESPEQAKSLQKCVSGHAGSLFGAGNYMTAVTDCKVEVIRLV